MPSDAGEVPPAPHPDLWRGQLTCTAASAVAARENIDPDAVTVAIQAKGAKRGDSYRCSDFPRGPE
jgi:hypothetical protein